jgi:hypothetical protein
VDADTGLITVKHQADFEKHTFIKFEVVATDGGGRTGSADVEVTIEDVNDYRPTFVKEFFNLEVPANIKVGSHICTLRATDNDSGKTQISKKRTECVNSSSGLRGDIRYYFLPADNNDYFELDEGNGKIYTDQKMQVDHKYVLYAFAEDKGLKVKDIKQTST